MSEFRPTITEAVDKLATLGSAAQIAEFFELQEIQGLPKAADYCPVARFVYRETQIPVVAGCEGVLPGSKAYRHVNGVSFWDDVTQQYTEEYAPVREFIENFDQEKYPNLIIEEEK